MALEPPPTAAMMMSGSRPSCSRICARASRADHRLEVAHQFRIGMRAGGGADQIIGVLDIGHPVAQRLVHGVLQRAVAGGDRPHLGAEQLHAEDVGLLPLDVGGAHIDDAGKAEARRDRGRGDAMLAGAGLGDDARLAHALGQQDLAEAVVDLVRAGVVQILALEIDLRAAEMLGQAFGEIELRRPAGIVGRQILQLGLEVRIVLGLVPVPFEVEDQRHQRFGDETAAENAEHALLVGSGAEGIGFGRLVHRRSWRLGLAVVCPWRDLPRLMPFRGKK